MPSEDSNLNSALVGGVFSIKLFGQADYCELAVCYGVTFFTWVMYPRRLLVATRFIERPRLFILGLSETITAYTV